MGCTLDREIGIEESLITYAESGLNFTSTSVETIDTIFRKYQCNGLLNQSHLIQASQNLDFRILNVGEHKHIQKFFNSLKQTEGYPLKDLLLISIMLGKGNVGTKAKLIYEIFDEQFSHQLDFETVKTEILHRMMKHAVNSMQILVNEKILDEEVKEKLEKRRRKLNEVIPFVCENVGKMFCIRGNVISVETFVEVMCEQPRLVSTSGIRSYLEEERFSFKQAILDFKNFNGGKCITK